MPFYRIESRCDYIGVVLDTSTRDNMARCDALKDMQKLKIVL